MNLTPGGLSSSSRHAFIPATPAPWLIRTAQAFVRVNLAFNNRLFIDDRDLETFRKIPPGCGIVLTSNHADEMDPRVCLELSRRSGRRFIFMCNREAFDEIFGLAGWVLQRLGLFSVERGARDHEAKAFAMDVVRGAKDVLVIFPEGEIFYLNEAVRPFHSGAIDICLQAIVQQRKTNPDFTAYIVPMGIKYHYEHSIESELENRIAKMEAALSLKQTGGTLQTRLLVIQKLLLRREEFDNNVQIDLSKQQLTQEIIATRKAILAEVEEKHQDMSISQQAQTIDQAWQLAAQIRRLISQQSDSTSRQKLEEDLSALKKVAQLSSWQPRYYSESSSPDRIAEGILKAERELYKIRRPPQLGKRSVLVTLADPIDMGSVIADYETDAHRVRHRVTEQLQDQIQSLVNTLTSRSAGM